MYHLISARWPDLAIVNKKKRTCRVVSFAVTAYKKVKLKEYEKGDSFRDLTREVKKTMEHESDSDTNCGWGTWYSHQKIDKRTEGLGNKRLSGD